MEHKHDIEVNLEICSGSLDAVLVLETVKTVERILFESEARDLEVMAVEFQEIPRVAIDAARFRLPKLKGHALKFTRAQPGSVILGGVLGGLAVWVLSATLGETLKQAWLDSDLHKRIKAFLLKRQRSKVLQMEHQIETKLPRKLERSHYSSSVVVSVLGNHPDYPSRLDIRVEATFVTLGTPSRGQVLSEEHEELITSSEHLSRADF